MTTATKKRRRKATRKPKRGFEIPWHEEENAFGVPEGRYLWRVVDSNTSESQKGDPQVVLDLVVVAPKSHKGKKQKVWFTITPGALRFFREACEALLGSKMPTRASKIDLDDFIGKTAYAEAQQNGDWTNIVNWESPDMEDDDEYDDEDFDSDLGDDDEDYDDEDDDLPWDDEDDEDDDDDDYDDDEDEDEEDEPAPRPRRRRRR